MKAATLPHLLPDNDRGSTCPQTKFIHQSALIRPRQCLKALLKFLFQKEPSYAATLKNWHFLKKINMCLSYNPATSHLGTYPSEMKTYVHMKTYTQRFIAALFIIIKK